MKHTSVSGNRLSPTQVNDALYYWHLYNGNASKVAKEVGTTPKTIINLARRENFEGKAALVQNRIATILSATDDPALQRLVQSDIKILEIAEMMLDDIWKAYKRKKLKVRTGEEAIKILHYIAELRTHILGKNNDNGEHTPQSLSIGNINILNLPKSERKNFLKVLTERAGEEVPVIDGFANLIS